MAIARQERETRDLSPEPGCLQPARSRAASCPSSRSQEKKRAIADVALGEANQAGGITREELLGLLD